MKLFKWTDKEGKEISWKEFKERFKQGINEVTPRQRLESSIFFQQIMTLGFFFGLCVSLYNYETTWWLAIILFGGLCINIIQYKGLKQQLGFFKEMDEQENSLKGLSEGLIAVQVGANLIEKNNQEDFLDALKGEDDKREE